MQPDEVKTRAPFSLLRWLVLLCALAAGCAGAPSSPTAAADDVPLRDTPGARFEYCSPGFHLLSALITRTTGLNAEACAREALFGPIGTTDWRWPRDPQGINQGAGDLQLPADAAPLKPRSTAAKTAADAAPHLDRRHCHGKFMSSLSMVG